MSNDHLRALAARDEAWLKAWNAYSAVQFGLANVPGKPAVDVGELVTIWERASDRVTEIEMAELRGEAA